MISTTTNTELISDLTRNVAIAEKRLAKTKKAHLKLLQKKALQVAKSEEMVKAREQNLAMQQQALDTEKQMAEEHEEVVLTE